MSKRSDGVVSKHLSSKVVEEVRQVVGLGQVVKDFDAVDDARNTFNGAFNELIDKGYASGDMVLGICLAIERFCERAVAGLIKDESTRKAMAESLEAALRHSIRVGCDIALTDD